MEQWITLLLQVPLVAVFIWFVLERDKRDAVMSAAREQREQTADAQREEQWRTFMLERDRLLVAGMSDVSVRMQELGKLTASQYAETRARIDALELLMRSHNGRAEGIARDLAALDGMTRGLLERRKEERQR